MGLLAVSGHNGDVCSVVHLHQVAAADVRSEIRMVRRGDVTYSVVDTAFPIRYTGWGDKVSYI